MTLPVLQLGSDLWIDCPDPEPRRIGASNGPRVADVGFIWRGSAPRGGHQDVNFSAAFAFDARDQFGDLRRRAVEVTAPAARALVRDLKHAGLQAGGAEIDVSPGLAGAYPSRITIVTRRFTPVGQGHRSIRHRLHIAIGDPNPDDYIDGLRELAHEAAIKNLQRIADQLHAAIEGPALAGIFRATRRLA